MVALSANTAAMTAVSMYSPSSSVTTAAASRM